MSEQKLDLEKIIKEDAEIKRKKHQEKREIKFKEYLKLLENDPLIAQNSPSRLLEIINRAGTEEIPETEQWMGTDRRYNLFSQLFGIEKSVAELVNFFNTGASRLSTGKKILLLIGPPASGKSTTVSIIKRALEHYDVRPVFMIKDCPMFEEPLHLLPRYLRKEIYEKLNILIEGDLCPPCRFNLENNFRDGDGVLRWEDVPVETFTFSEQGRRGIGSFVPTQELAADVTVLSGKPNIAYLKFGPNHPLAYSLSGELEIGNRGVCEGVEMIKCDEKLLWTFIGVGEEKLIKVHGSTFPNISVDIAVIGHTNLNEYKEFCSRKENEALHDRIFVIPFIYPLKVKDEIKIYRKLIQTESDFSSLKKCHIAPGSLEMAAIFAILTRMSPSQMGIDSLTKLKLYNGDKALTEIEDREKRPIDNRQIREEGQANADISKREGMFGISSRAILNALNTALVEQAGKNGCLTPLKTIKALRERLEYLPGITAEDVEKYKILLSAGEGGTVITEYEDFILKTVNKAFLKAYSPIARSIIRDYIKEVDLYHRRKSKFLLGHQEEIEREPESGKPREPNLKQLRSVEMHAGINEDQADIFRSEVLITIAIMAKQPNFKYENIYDRYPALAKAVDKKLLADNKNNLAHLMADHESKTEEDRKRINEMFKELSDSGCCEICANEFLKKASKLINA